MYQEGQADNPPPAAFGFEQEAYISAPQRGSYYSDVGGDAGGARRGSYYEDPYDYEAQRRGSYQPKRAPKEKRQQRRASHAAGDYGGGREQKASKQRRSSKQVKDKSGRRSSRQHDAYDAADYGGGGGDYGGGGGYDDAISYKEKKSIAEILEEEEKGVGIRKNKHEKQTSTFGGWREVFSVRDLDQFENDRDPQMGVRILMIEYIVILLLVVISFGAAETGMFSVSADFGDEVVEWKYGYAGSVIKDKNTGYRHKYVKFMAQDVGSLFLFVLLFSVLVSIVGMWVLCVRYQSHLAYYISCCGIRILQRQTLNVLYGIVKQMLWICMLWYLLCAFYGLLELNFYVTYNCSGSVCSTVIVPGYGWLCQVVVVLILSCCTYVQVRRLDPALKKNTMHVYYPKHQQAAKSPSPPIKLEHVLACQEHCRNAMMYSLVIYFMQNSSLILFGYTTKESSAMNVVGMFMPLGWYNARDHPSIDADAAKQLIAAGDSLGTIVMLMCWALVFVLFGLMVAVNRFDCGKILKSFFTVLGACLMLLWVYGIGFFYSKAFSYWTTGGGTSYVVVDEDVGELKSKFIIPGWGVFVAVLLTWNLLKMCHKGYLGL